MFDSPVFKTQPDHFNDVEYYKDPKTERLYLKVVSGVCPPNMHNPGYIVLAGLQFPEAGQSPMIWLIEEKAYSDVADLLLDMSRAHAHYKVDTHYARFKRSKEDDRVYDDFLRHVQRFNLEALGERRAHIRVQDTPWTNDRGHLKFFLEKLREELRIGKRGLYWNEPSPPSVLALNGVDEWELLKDDNTMLGALCYAVAGLLIDKPMYDPRGKLQTGYGVEQLKGDFDPLHTLNRFKRGNK